MQSGALFPAKVDTKLDSLTVLVGTTTTVTANYEAEELGYEE